MTNQTKPRTAPSATTWQAPKWASGHEETDAGITWLRLATVTPIRHGELIGEIEEIEIWASQTERLSIVDGQVTVSRGDVDILIDGQIYELAEARKLATAVIEACDAVANEG